MELHPEREYHWQDKWYFWRKDNGDVCMEHRVGSPLYEPIITIPANEWASIVASVSTHGDNNPYYQQALDFHNGK